MLTKTGRAEAKVAALTHQQTPEAASGDTKRSLAKSISFLRARPCPHLPLLLFPILPLLVVEYMLAASTYRLYKVSSFKLSSSVRNMKTFHSLGSSLAVRAPIELPTCGLSIDLATQTKQSCSLRASVSCCKPTTTTTIKTTKTCCQLVSPSIWMPIDVFGS